jgi:hypothetical protein
MQDRNAPQCYVIRIFPCLVHLHRLIFFFILSSPLSTLWKLLVVEEGFVLDIHQQNAQITYKVQLAPYHSQTLHMFRLSMRV